MKYAIKTISGHQYQYEDNVFTDVIQLWTEIRKHGYIDVGRKRRTLFGTDGSVVTEPCNDLVILNADIIETITPLR